ncbi:hypothetical protein Acr_21g0002540 [Actinidia rufa]|uniref:Uncharacterized protein n=1 Tax=Actinidia rufa TaxID=165716 RepID=A0A7J0GFV8_9ERIC|nr:hypothetical protein Acr_21g0002540 [Actinidia rufa]
MKKKDTKKKNLPVQQKLQGKSPLSVRKWRVSSGDRVSALAKSGSSLIKRESFAGARSVGGSYWLPQKGSSNPRK